VWYRDKGDKAPHPEQSAVLFDEGIVEDMIAVAAKTGCAVSVF
jgi:hypothetical protein